MLNDWGKTIFTAIKYKLQSAAMRLVELERNGEAFDPQLVVGVRQSYGDPIFYFFSLFEINSLPSSSLS